MIFYENRTLFLIKQQYLKLSSAANSKGTLTVKCGKKFHVTTNIGCDVKAHINVMQCTKCDEEYIGETGDSLRQGMT